MYRTENQRRRGSNNRLRNTEEKSKRFNIQLNRIPEGDKSDYTYKVIFKEWIVETFPELVKDMNLQTHEAHPIPNGVNF